MILSNSTYLGMGLAISASIFWTFSAVFLSDASSKIGPYYVNIMRLGMATLFLSAFTGVYILMKGDFNLLVVSWRDVLWLGLSGIAGLAVGDTFYLWSLTLLGPQRATQLLTLGPIVPVILGWVLLGEQLQWVIIGGIIMINAGMRLECLQVLMGHRSIEETRRYAQLTDKTREEEYFTAMSKIERRIKNDDDRHDHELEAILETEKLLTQYREELSEHH